MSTGDADAGSSSKARPVSTASISSQLSISDRMTDGDEEDVSLRNLMTGTASSCSSLNITRSLPQDQSQASQSQMRLSSSPTTMPRTTTISTIAMESNTGPPGSKCNRTRLVIALLQTPHRGLQLKVIELNPPLLQLPDSRSDAEEFLKNHNQVIKNLQSKQSPVEELMRQADNLIATQKPRAEVYAAMADSLGQTWKDLNGILEERRIVIQLAFEAHKNISDCIKKMDEVHAQYSRISYFRDDKEEMIQAAQFLNNLKVDRTDILKKVAVCLESCDHLLHKIAEYNYSVDSRELVLLKDVERATRQVQRWLELLHDRRIILEEKLRNKREMLEELSDNFNFDGDLIELTQELEQYVTFSNPFSFGDSVPSAQRGKEYLGEIGVALRKLQEKSLGVAKRLENSYGQSRFTPRFNLKNKIYEILSQITNLLAEVTDLDSSIANAMDFFRVADNTTMKLDSFAVKGDPDARSELTKSVNEALSKGEVILNAYGWESPKTKGVRDVHTSLLRKRNALFEQLEHLVVLDEYNKFLELVNQTYQNILNIQTSEVKQCIIIPTTLDSVLELKTTQERTLADVTRKLGLDSLMTKLEQIYPHLSEEEKCGTEAKINELKSLSNLIVQLLSRRIDLASNWIEIMETYNEAKDGRTDPKKALDNITTVVYQIIKPLLQKIHPTDPYLKTIDMEREMTRLTNELKSKAASSVVSERIRDVCSKYKAQLDAHLLGDLEAGSLPQYYPVLPSDTPHLHAVSKASGIQDIIQLVLKPKLENVLAGFFQPLLTSYRQEILDSSPDPLQLREKSVSELDFERYCDRLKESYVTVTKEIESFLTLVLSVHKKTEQVLGEKEQFYQKENIADALQENIQQLDTARKEINSLIKTQVGQRFERLIQVIKKEESPREGVLEMDTLRSIMAEIGHDDELDTRRAELVRDMKEHIVKTDLDLYSTQLDHLIHELDLPASYGNNVKDAEENLWNYEQFERTVETLTQKLTNLLATLELPESNEMVASIRNQISVLSQKRQRRRELIQLSLQYFKLIDESWNHYEKVNTDLNHIREKANDPDIGVEKIEKLFRQLRDIKGQQDVQEQKLAEIEKIAKILFGPSELAFTTQHGPLKEKNDFMTGSLVKVESDLNELLQIIKSRPIIQPHVASQPVSTIEIHEMQTTSLISTLRRSVSPMPLPTVEKQTQFEAAETEPQFEKTDRDTQTVDDKIISIETQTELVKSSSAATETIEVQVRPRTPSRVCLNPAFVESLKDVTVKEGENVLLECRTFGLVKQIAWLKDGIDVSNNSDYKTRFDNDRATLCIDEAVLEDSAVFTCRVTGGEDGTIVTETSGRLTVKEPLGARLQSPEFLPHPPIFEGVHGKPQVIQLVVKGNPLPTVQWFRNGQCIDTSPDYIITFNNGLCRIEFDEVIKEVDEGIYSCVASNKVGESETHIEFRVQGDGSQRLSQQKPIIIRPLPKCLVGRTGQPLKLQCEFTSETECNILWWKDNVVINHANSSADIKTVDNVATLSFAEVYPVDVGKYTILIRNAVGEVKSECQVSVKGLTPSETSDSEFVTSDVEANKLVVKMALKDANIDIGEDAKLDCVITGQGLEPEVTWYKDDAPINESSTHQIVFDGDQCSLVIKAVSPSDSGKYTVVAVDPEGGHVRSSCDLLVGNETAAKEGAITMEQPTFKTIIQDQMVTAGDKYTFQVELSPDCDESTQVEWFKNNQKIESGDGVELLKDGKVYSLVINDCKMSNRGNYLAKASNAAGTAKCFACLNVKENLEFQQKAGGDLWEEPGLGARLPTVTFARSVPLNKPPRFARTLDNKIVKVEECNVVLKCILEANPPAEVKWTKDFDTELLTPSHNLSMSYNEKTGDVELVFRQVGISDTGRYTCTASNDLGEATTSCNLVVKKPTFPPVFSKRILSQTLEEGKRLYLEIDVFGKPIPDVVWYLNGQQVLAGEDISMKSDTPTRHALIITKVDALKHAGEYKAVAKNEAGEASSACIISVLPSPSMSVKTPLPEPSREALPWKEQETFVQTTLLQHEMSKFESTTTVSATGAPLSFLPAAISQPEPLVYDGVMLLPGPEPEVLVAPGPSRWRSASNQVQEKVKTFEIRSEAPDIPSPPSGGVRIIPMKTPSAPKDVSSKMTEFPFTPLPSLQPPIVPPTDAVFLEQPKQYFDSSFTTSKEEHKTDEEHVKTETTLESSVSSSEAKYFRPSKFIPEKMRESDHDTDVDAATIPIKWAPQSSVAVTAPTTTSAFVPFRPGTVGLTSTSSCLYSGQRTFQSAISSSVPKPTVAPKPAYMAPHVRPVSPAPERVRQLIKSWPPQETTTAYHDGLLSPRYDPGRGRSPTPSRDAIEMEKLWSRPIRFSSPTKHLFGSPMTSPPPLSPGFIHSPTPPLIHAKPFFTPSPKPYSPLASPLSPTASKPASTPKSPKDGMYYYSVVSTPRTTPVPATLSPTPEPELSFMEKKEFFEQSSSYSSFEETKSSTYHHKETSSSSMSKSFQETKTSSDASHFPLLYASFLPPPGEEPEYLYAPPPMKPKPGPRPSAGTVSSTYDKMAKCSTSEARSAFSQKDFPKPKFHEIRITPPSPPAPDTIIKQPCISTLPAHSSTTATKAIVPYIKPSKFTPKLDYAASLEQGRSDTDMEPIPPKWRPKDSGVTVTTWKRVSYEPPSCSTIWEGVKPRRSSLTILVDQRMQDLNKKFKDNINLMTQGICYNKSDRRMASQVEPSQATEAESSSVEANPLIYFKYDFGYEFGIADPKSVIRALSEPPSETPKALPPTTRPKSFIEDESGTITVPVIHETTKPTK